MTFGKNSVVYKSDNKIFKKMDFDDEELFQDLLDMEIIDFGFPRKIYNRSNCFDDLDNLTFFRRFRLYKETALHLLTLIEDDLEYPNNR